MPTLDVPYFVQPTTTHCQATCLKMMASYLDRRLGQPMQRRDILQIKSAVNAGQGRPSTIKNAWVNFRWWLEQEFGADVDFALATTADANTAVNTIRTAIGAQFPVLVSTNHLNVRGHIILVVGLMANAGGKLVEPPAGPVSADWRFVCHDPNGAFDPQLGDPRHGKRRYEGGMSTPSGEIGPGRGLVLDLAGIRRVRRDQHSPDTFLLLRPTKLNRACVKCTP